MVNEKEYNSVVHKVNKIPNYILNSKDSGKMIYIILKSSVHNLIPLYRERGIIDLDEKVAPELQNFWGDVLPMVGNKVKFVEEEKVYLRENGELPCILLQDIYNLAKKDKRIELSSKLDLVISIIEGK